jgi:UDP-N-acetylmuramyl pentapeptide phosphotransferase/UDP-N-acetylglucosamine-1-phosphate transferase
LTTLQAALAGAALALATALALAWAVSWCGPVDPVKERSSHARPTPTSAGVGVLAGTAAGAALFAALAPIDGFGPVGLLLAFAATLALFGAADDLFDVSAKLKLAVQAALSLGFAVGVARVEALPLAPGLELPVGVLLGTAGTVLFLVVLLNAVNFMDGSNGLAPGAGVVALTGLALSGIWTTVEGGPQTPAAAAGVALAAAGAGLGLLAWNGPGRVFQGDAGALFTAAMIGGVGLLLAQAGVTTPYFVVFTVLPMLTDVLLTLLSRARRRQSLFVAHREHLYQLWLDATGRSHAALAWRFWALTAACTFGGMVVDFYFTEWTAPALAAGVAALSAGWVLARREMVRRLGA